MAILTSGGKVMSTNCIFHLLICVRRTAWHLLRSCSLVCWISVALMVALLAPQAHAQVMQQNCTLANPNSNGLHVAEICWLEFAPPGPNLAIDVSGTLAAPGTQTDYEIKIPDGSILTYTAKFYGGSETALILANSAPTWADSHFSGNSFYYRLPATSKPVFYSAPAGAYASVVRMENIRLFNPNGDEVTDLPFQIIVADSETLNQQERLDFGVFSGGTPWTFMEYLGAASNPAPGLGTPATIAPAIPSHCWASGAPIGVDCIRLNGVVGNTRSSVFATSRVVNPANPQSAQPFTVAGQINSVARQGFAVGVRWASIKLRKTWGTTRYAASDQVNYKIVNGAGVVAAQGTTTGATTTPSAWVSSVALPGNVFTIQEEMVATAASSLSQYDRWVTCTGQQGTDTSTSTVLLSQTYDPSYPPQINVGSQAAQAGYTVNCDLTNRRIATVTNIQKALATINGQPASPGAPVAIGDVLGYRIVVSNPSATAAATMPIGSIVEAIPAGTTPTAANTDFSCYLNTCKNTAAKVIPANGQTVLNFFVVLDNPGPTQTEVHNGVSATGANCALPANTCSVSNPFAVNLVQANGDSATVATSSTAQLALNVLVGDTLAGNPATVSNVAISVVPNPNNSSALSLNTTTGGVTVAAGTPPGVYTLEYQICETNAPSNCDTAVATVQVSAGPLVAGNDTTTVPSSPTDQPGGNVLDGDTLGGTPVTIDEVVISVVPNPSNSPELVLNPNTGEVTVVGGTPPGTYTLEYQICEKDAPSNCDTAIKTVNVSAGQLPPMIPVPREVDFSVVDQNPPPIGPEISLDGSTPTPWSELVVTVSTPAQPQEPGAPVPTIDPLTGVVVVPAQTPPGTYTIELEVCERAVGNANCATVILTVEVNSVIDAVDAASPPISSVPGGQTGNMFSGNTLNGQPVNLPDVVVTVTEPATPLESGASVPVVDVTSGIVTVPPGTPPGTYTIGYQMCDRSDLSECDNAVLTIIVTQAPPAVPVPVPVDHPVGLLLAALGVVLGASRLRRRGAKPQEGADRAMR